MYDQTNVISFIVTGPKKIKIKINSKSYHNVPNYTCNLNQSKPNLEYIWF